MCDGHGNPELRCCKPALEVLGGCRVAGELCGRACARGEVSAGLWRGRATLPAAILGGCLHAEDVPGRLPGLLARPEHSCVFPAQEKLTIGT